MAKSFSRLLSGPLAFLPKDDLSTDEIIPSRFLLTTTVDGLGNTLFRDMRFDDNDCEISDFVLNQPEYRTGAILVVGKNFGCGSSREHAVWAITDFGIIAIVCESASGSFLRNAAHNNLSVVHLSATEMDALRRCKGRADSLLTASLCFSEKRLQLSTEQEFFFSMSSLQQNMMRTEESDLFVALSQMPTIRKKWGELKQKIKGRDPRECREPSGRN